MTKHRFRDLIQDTPPAPRPEGFIVVPVGLPGPNAAFAAWQMLLYAWAWQQAQADNAAADSDSVTWWN
jgi:hypothetical protein